MSEEQAYGVVLGIDERDPLRGEIAGESIAVKEERHAGIVDPGAQHVFERNSPVAQIVFEIFLLLTACGPL